MSANRYRISYREAAIVLILMAGFALVAARAAYLQLVVNDRLQDEGAARFVRNQTIAASRGLLQDRNGKILAISTPVDSVLGVPDILKDHRGMFPALAAVLDTTYAELQQAVDNGLELKRKGILLKRQLNPSHSARVMSLEIPGVSLVREYRRFYPNANQTSSVLGFTDIDDVGLEGVELMLNGTLQGTSGLNRVINDSRGRTVEKIAQIRSVEDGRDVRLSIDVRIQQILHSRLIQALNDSKAAHATGVVVDPATGEIMAIATVPGFNPHRRNDGTITRNRAATDLFEPGSIIKPFVIAKAIEDSIVTPDTLIDTSPGTIKIDGYRVDDIRNFGTLSVADVVMRSSNVAMVKIGLEIPPNELLDYYRRFGFGARTQNLMPGEHAGLFPSRDVWRESEHASLAYGYGFAVSALQTVQAYAAFANEGTLMPLTLLKDGNAGKIGTLAIDPGLARTMNRLLERTSLITGTARRAKMPLYKVAGKTATIQKLIDGKYSSEHHVAIYAGFAPASNPRLAMVVVVDDPQSESHYGGVVAAPVFRDVVSESLRILNQPFDDLQKIARNS